MGIPRLWDAVKEHDHIVPTARLAEEHFQQKGRPLRIAIDEADWRYNNVSDAEVERIRNTKPSNGPYQGQEKNIFYRICKLLALNIQLVFVFDGKGRPAKRGRTERPYVNHSKRKLILEVLDCFNIPYYEAPGEAEADCARLQALGLVDAVWSQDSDTFMFGCDFVIRDNRIVTKKGSTNFSKGETEKCKTTVKVVRGKDIQAHLGLDREALVLFAMLCGGDYEKTGLLGAGPAAAMVPIRAGLGKDLCRCRTQEDCKLWRNKLEASLRGVRAGPPIHVPLDFPNIEVLGYYNRPLVSTDQQLKNLQSDWVERSWAKSDQPFKDERTFLQLTINRFNIWGKSYMKWIGPILLTRALTRGEAIIKGENVHGINPVQKRVRKGSSREETISRPLERQVTFSPFGLTSLCRDDLEPRIWPYIKSPGQLFSAWTGPKDENYNPRHRVECDIPNYWLQRSLPSETLDQPTTQAKGTPATRKRKLKEDNSIPKRTKKSDVNPMASISLPINPKAPSKTPLADAGNHILPMVSVSGDGPLDAFKVNSAYPRRTAPGLVDRNGFAAVGHQQSRMPVSLQANEKLPPSNDDDSEWDYYGPEDDAVLLEIYQEQERKTKRTPSTPHLSSNKQNAKRPPCDESRRTPLGLKSQVANRTLSTSQPLLISPDANKSNHKIDTPHGREQKDPYRQVPQPSTRKDPNVHSLHTFHFPDQERVRSARLQHFRGETAKGASSTQDIALVAKPSFSRSGTRYEPINLD